MLEIRDGGLRRGELTKLWLNEKNEQKGLEDNKE